MEAHNFNVHHAADAAGIPRGTLQHRWAAAKHWHEIQKPALKPDLPDETLSADELLAQRAKVFTRKSRASQARKLIPIEIQVDGPIGIAHFGDPHVDDDGTDLAQLRRHIDIVNHTAGLFAGNVGDYQNNWIGRLARLWSQQSTGAKEARVLADWLVRACDWLYLVGGNHDAWTGDHDPIEWIAAQTNALYQPFAARLELHFPNRRRIRINARHDFKGRSMWNTAHGPARAAQMGWRDHILTCGHTHVSGYNVLKDPSSGLISHALRVASYKLYDRFQVEQGLPDQNIFLCPVTIIHPQYDDSDPRLITTVFEPEMGADFLTFLRKRKAA